jgi:hypothetical protein
VGNGPGSTIRDRHSLGFIHSLQRCTLISVGRMAQGGEWSRFRNQDNYSFFLEKNSPDSSLLMFYLLRAYILSGLTDVSERLAQMIQFIS